MVEHYYTRHLDSPTRHCTATSYFNLVLQDDRHDTTMATYRTVIHCSHGFTQRGIPHCFIKNLYK